MWFRNLQIFRLSDGWDFTTEQLNLNLQRGVFQACGATDRTARGWVPPRGE
ncbi:MAG: recombination-associated protein RdgC, partial [Rhodocyclaceae bacterium]|nr:recombination-associated protein RdgC [Rhodocyclaceae bacterium]